MVEQAWRVVSPALGDAGPAHPYPPGSWGPAPADHVVGGGYWHDPTS